MEDMGPVEMDEDAGSIQTVIGVAPDMRSPVNYQDRLIKLTRHSLRYNRSREARTYHKIVKHLELYTPLKCRG